MFVIKTVLASLSQGVLVYLKITPNGQQTPLYDTPSFVPYVPKSKGGRNKEYKFRKIIPAIVERGKHSLIVTQIVIRHETISFHSALQLSKAQVYLKILQTNAAL